MPDLDRAAADLRKELAPERVLTAPEDMVVYSYDGTWVVGKPQIAVLPLTAQEVAATVRVAAAEGIPIVPRGAHSAFACLQNVSSYVDSYAHRKRDHGDFLHPDATRRSRRQKGLTRPL